MITPGTLVETEGGKKALAKTVKGLTFVAAATASAAVLAAGANPFAGMASLGDNPFSAPMSDAANPFSASMPDIAANAGGTNWFGDIVQNEHVQKGIKEGFKSFFQGDDSSANNQSELSDADYGVVESVLMDGESMGVDSFEFDGSEIADVDGGGIVGGVMDFLGGFFE